MAKKSTSQLIDELKLKIKKESKALNRIGREQGYRSKYANKYKLVNGKKVLWDTRTNKAFDAKSMASFVNQETYGTKTPLKDLEYLTAKEKLAIQKKRGVDPIRNRFSDKLVDGGTVYEKEFADKISNAESNLTDLSIGTKYDHSTNPNSPDYKAGGEEVGTMVNGVFQTGTGPVVEDTASAVNVNTKTNETEDTSRVTDNEFGSNLGTGETYWDTDMATNTKQTKDGLKIDPLKEGSAGWKIQQDLISKGFKQGELDDLRINHQKWKEQRRKRNKNKNKKKP